MTTTIAIAHHKGGVGKTTTAAHLGHEMAEQGRRVLIVDLDPQASLTSLVGCETPADQPAPYAQAVESGSLEGHTRWVERWGVDVLPANPRLVAIEHIGRPGIDQQLRRMLESEGDQWDMVFIDAPGSLGVLTTTALAAASGGVVVPTSPDYLALEPLATVLGLIEDVRDAYQPGCVLAGLVVNAQANTTEHRQQAASLAASLGNRILGTVPRRAVIQQAAAEGIPLTRIHTGPAAQVREAYATIAAALEAVSVGSAA